MTTLFAATSQGNAECLELLLRCEANPNNTDAEHTALMSAAVEEHTMFLLSLLTNSADSDNCREFLKELLIAVFQGMLNV